MIASAPRPPCGRTKTSSSRERSARASREPWRSGCTGRSSASRASASPRRTRRPSGCSPTSPRGCGSTTAPSSYAPPQRAADGLLSTGPARPRGPAARDRDPAAVRAARCRGVPGGDSRARPRPARPARRRPGPARRRRPARRAVTPGRRGRHAASSGPRHRAIALARVTSHAGLPSRARACAAGAHRSVAESHRRPLRLHRISRSGWGSGTSVARESRTCAGSWPSASAPVPSAPSPTSPRDAAPAASRSSDSRGRGRATVWWAEVAERPSGSWEFRPTASTRPRTHSPAPLRPRRRRRRPPTLRAPSPDGGSHARRARRRSSSPSPSTPAMPWRCDP